MAYQSVVDATNIVLLRPGYEDSPTILDKTDYTKTAAGATAHITGESGHVMLQVPRFYYSYGYSGTIHTYKVSLTPFVGSSLHPWFVKSGVEVPYRYYGIYPACWYDVSAGAYVNGDGTNSGFDTLRDKIGSISGKKPLSNLTRAQFRAAARRNGVGWHLTDFWAYAAMKLLYRTYYGNWNSQSVLGQGNTRFSSFTFSTCISATGKVHTTTAAGQSTEGGSSGDYVNLFGIEDIFGGLWEFVDGWNIQNGNNYICSSPENFADNTTSNYALYGSTNSTTSGWQNTLQKNIAMLPDSVGGTASSSTKVTDYYYYNSGWIAPWIGGHAGSGANAGLAYLGAHSVSSDFGSALGGRLCF